MIPGISGAITCWRVAMLPNDIEHYHEYVPPQAGKPSRREGLRLVQAIYENEKEANIPADSIGFLVVDDVDLSDL